MGPVLYDNFSEGPTMILSPSQNHPSFQFPSQSTQGLQAYDSSSWSMDARCATPFKAPMRHSSNWTSASSAKSLFTNPSRKRSRNDSEDETVSSSKTSVTLPPPAVEAPIYGEGMVLLNPRTRMAVSAESQTGTWYEEQAEMKASNKVSASSRLPHSADLQDGPSRKSQRLDISASGMDDVEIAWIRQQMQSTTNDDTRRSHGKNGSLDMADEPQVDDVTLLLGISWQSVSHDNVMAPAVNGWEKFINNHYQKYLRNARIILKNRSLNAYLVAALPTQYISALDTTSQSNFSAMPATYQFDPASYFFLFKEDLTEAQLVAPTLDICLRNLRSTPIHFEGTEILRASERSPERTINNEGNDHVNCIVGNGIPIARISKEDRAGLNCDSLLSNNDTVMSMGTDMDVDL